MRIDFQLDETNLKQRLLSCCSPILLTQYILRMEKRMTDYTKGQNLNMKTLSQFGGKHQRNILTAKQTKFYYLLIPSFFIMDNLLIIFFQVYSDKLDKNTRFYIHNFIWVMFIDCFFCFYVPLKHLLLSRESMPSLWLDGEPERIIKFYTRQPSMIPRRYVTHDNVIRAVYNGLISVKSGGKSKNQFNTNKSSASNTTAQFHMGTTSTPQNMLPQIVIS